MIFVERNELDLGYGERRVEARLSLDAEGLQRVVPDLAGRHAYISGPPGLIADLAPALEKARSITTDAC